MKLRINRSAEGEDVCELLFYVLAPVERSDTGAIVYLTLYL